SCLRCAAATEIYTLSLHDALPICWANAWAIERAAPVSLRSGVQRVAHRLLGGAIEGLAGGGFSPFREAGQFVVAQLPIDVRQGIDRKSTRLNSSHVKISYAVFCLK